MTDKKRNNGKRQIPSMDAKEFYEIFMRNHDEINPEIEVKWRLKIETCLFCYVREEHVRTGNEKII